MEKNELRFFALEQSMIVTHALPSRWIGFGPGPASESDFGGPKIAVAQDATSSKPFGGKVDDEAVLVAADEPVE
jgi:hypothetical protein